MVVQLVARIVLLALLAIVTGPVLAEEGMWPLYDLGQVPFDSLQKHGLVLSPTDIYNPGGGGLSDAVINLRGERRHLSSPTV